MISNVKELLKAHEGLKREVYLDNENATAVPHEVLQAMNPYWNQRSYGNPTLTHKPGWEAYETIMESAQKIARYLNCRNLEEVNFTPGETEANNLAFMGALAQMRGKGKRIVISEIEPTNVLNVAEMVQKTGFELTKIPVNTEGFLNQEKLDEAIDKDCAFVSISLTNHEIGTIQRLKQIIKIVKDQNPSVIFHTDASDSFGRIPFDVKELNVDLATVSSFKILGPRGIGALYVKEGVNIERILEGQIGTQRLWPGIENTPLIAGLARATQLALDRFEENVKRMKKLRDMLIDGIIGGVSETILNGPKGIQRAPDNVNLSFLKCEGEAMTIELSLKGVYVSSGSACSRRLLQPSHVLAAIGRKFDQAHGSLLMKVTRYNTEEDINYVLDVIPKAAERIRGIVGSTGVE